MQGEGTTCCYPSPLAHRVFSLFFPVIYFYFCAAFCLGQIRYKDMDGLDGAKDESAKVKATVCVFFFCERSTTEPPPM